MDFIDFGDFNTNQDDDIISSIYPQCIYCNCDVMFGTLGTVYKFYCKKCDLYTTYYNSNNGLKRAADIKFINNIQILVSHCNNSINLIIKGIHKNKWVDFKYKNLSPPEMIRFVNKYLKLQSIS